MEKSVESKIIKTTALHLPPRKDHPRNSEGSFAELSDGRILFVYSHYRGDCWFDNATSDLMSRVSSDGGRTWSSEDRLTISHGNALNLMSVSLLRLADGRLAMFHLRKSASEERGVDCMPLIRFSSDDGETWSEPNSIARFPGYFVVNNDRIIQLPSGRLIVPAAWHRPTGRDSTDSRAIGLFFISDDAGASFREAADWVLPPQHSGSGLQEPGVILLGNGNLAAYFRTDTGCQYQAFSKDEGEHWSAAEPSGFRSPCSPLSIKRRPETNELFAVWNDDNAREKWNLPKPEESSWGRTPLVMARSRDNGCTWNQYALLENNPKRGYCYTAMHFTKDNGLLLAFCCGGVETAVLQELKIVRIELNQ